MCILTVLIAHTLTYLCMSATPSPSIMTNDTIIKSTTTPIDATTTTSKAAVDNTVDANNAGT